MFRNIDEIKKMGKILFMISKYYLMEFSIQFYVISYKFILQGEIVNLKKK